MYKNNAKIQELKAEFLKLQENEDFDFAPDNDGFIDWLAATQAATQDELKRLRTSVREHNCDHCDLNF